LGRVINLNENAKERKQLNRSVVLALRELSMQNTVSDDTKDLVAFISIALRKIMSTVENSVIAWEKRGYWLKADRYRMEWIWTETFSKKLSDAIYSDNWHDVALLAAQVSEKLQDIKLPKRHRLGTPWVGAWKKLRDLERAE
jgi:hypothetical protein